MRSREFTFDLAALVPLDLLQFRFGCQPLLRFPRFFKVSLFFINLIKINFKKNINQID